MTRPYIFAFLLALLVALIGAALFVGIRWDEAKDERKRSDTFERIQDADTSKGDPDVDDAWLRDFLSGL